MSEFENIPLDAAYDLPIIQFLNDLSYLKEKEQYDKRLLNAYQSEQP